MFSNADAVSRKACRFGWIRTCNVEIRRLPDRNGQRVVGVVEQVLNDRDVLVLVLHDLVDQLGVQSGKLARDRPREPSWR